MFTEQINACQIENLSNCLTVTNTVDIFTKHIYTEYAKMRNKST